MGRVNLINQFIAEPGEDKHKQEEKQELEEKQERIARLSRGNNTLYEFILPGDLSEEDEPEEKQIGHVIIKADLRGSTDITYKMKEAGLNPATYFTYYFFDPIAAILSEYGAKIVFIEGDAMILSIAEYRDAPQHRYCVARACGLAVEILNIIRQYNKKNKVNELPALELGIGICYQDKAPAFLFDGDREIMISPAINLADRLSSCSRVLRNKRRLRRTRYNLFVFQHTGNKTGFDSVDDVYLRYNVNGIELNSAGFIKLRREIDLRYMKTYISGPERVKVRFFTGQYPTEYGETKCLVIRQQLIPVVDDAQNLKTIANTGKKYYEVCTDSVICGEVKKKAALVWKKRR
jgi:hypothetical protein